MRSSARVWAARVPLHRLPGLKGVMDQSQQLYFEFRDRRHFSASFFVCVGWCSVSHYAMDWAILQQLIMRLS